MASWRFAILALLANFAVSGEAMPAWKAKLQPDSDKWKSVKQELVFNNDTEPETLDPALMTGVPESRLTLALFEGLISYDPDTLAARPGVAKSWEISEDGTVYTFHLRADSAWSDGRKLTAADFVRSWKRALEPKTAAQYAYQLFTIAGAEDYNRGASTDFSKVGIEAPDESTLRVRLKQPCPWFLDLCGFQTLMPVPVDVVEKWGDAWVKAEHLVCNGPFRLESWVPRGSIVMVPNEHYWDRAQVRLTKLTALPYDDVETAYKKFQEGGLHWMFTVPVAKIDEVKKLPEYYAVPYLGTYFYRFNCSHPPFDDARVRKAFSLALDRSIITDHVLKGGQRPATWFCPDVAGYTHVAGLAYDPAQAKKLLVEAGYNDQKKFPPVELLYNTSDAHKQVAESVVQQWRANLGVEVSLRNSEWKVYLADVEKMDYQIARGSWIGDYGDPNTFMDLWVTGGGNNRTGWSNKAYDDLLAASQAERDPQKRIATLKKMESILVEQELPIMPVYMYVNQGLLKDAVRGWHENVRDIHPFQYLWME